MVTAETVGPHLLPQCVHAVFPGDAVLAVYDHLVRNLAEQSRHSLCRIVVPMIHTHTHTVVGNGASGSIQFEVEFCAAETRTLRAP